MKFFVKCQRNAIDNFLVYDGQDQPIVTQLLTDMGATNIQFITEAEYIAATTAASISPAQAAADYLAQCRASAITQLLTETGFNAKNIRAVLMVILDEINVIRALLPGPPAPRTITQLKTAITNKINSGASD